MAATSKPYTVTTWDADGTPFERRFATVTARQRYLENHLFIAYNDIVHGDTGDIAGMATVNGRDIAWGVTKTTDAEFVGTVEVGSGEMFARMGWDK